MSENISIVYNSKWQEITPKYPDKYFDFVIADIPYGIDVGNMAFIKENKTLVKQKNGAKINPNKNKIIHEFSDWDKHAPGQDYFDEMVRISKHQIIFGVEYVDWIGLGNGRIKWNKGVAEGVSFKKHEMAYCSAIDYEIEIPLLWAGMCQAKSLSEPMTQQGNKKLNEKRIHPCHKPIMLYDKLLLEFGFKGMKIFDSHLGSGSIRISADKFGVSEFVGCEVGYNHYTRQENRWKQYKSSLKLPFVY